MADRARTMPGDLLAAVALTAATLAFTLIPPLSELPLRVPLGLAMVLFLPGYALIAALFPRKDDLDGIERVALSLGLSIAVVPLMGLALNYTPWGIRLAPVAISLFIFVTSMAVVASVRRKGLPDNEVFSVDINQGIAALRAGMATENQSSLDRALTVLLVISIIASVAALVYVVATPKQGEKFTEFYILGPGGKAYDYPTSVESGEECTVIVGIVNHEYDAVNYTIEMSLDNATMLKREILLNHNETWEKPVSYTLKDPGDLKKLEFLLYKDGNWTSPYRDLHLWVNVSEEAGRYHEGSSISPHNMTSNLSSPDRTPSPV